MSRELMDKVRMAIQGQNLETVHASDVLDLLVWFDDRLTKLEESRVTYHKHPLRPPGYKGPA